jgi:hypothetical protein
VAAVIPQCFTADWGGVVSIPSAREGIPISPMNSWRIYRFLLSLQNPV